MKIARTILLGSLLVATSLFASDVKSGEALFKEKCAVCHLTQPPEDMSTLVAPPLFGVMRHVKMKYENKEEALAFMRDYVMNPDAKKAVCMPMKLKRFGVMPSQKGNVTPEELAEITEWMYDNFPPKNFQGGMMRMQQQ